jgi:hypothetical protein
LNTTEKFKHKNILIDIILVMKIFFLLAFSELPPVGLCWYYTEMHCFILEALKPALAILLNSRLEIKNVDSKGVNPLWYKSSNFHFLNQPQWNSALLKM